MEKNAIKKYAVWARTEMIARVAQKALSYGIADGDILPATADSINGKLLTLSEMQQRQALIARIEAKGYGMGEIMKELDQQGARAGIVFAGLSQNVGELRKNLVTAK